MAADARLIKAERLANLLLTRYLPTDAQPLRLHGIMPCRNPHDGLLQGATDKVTASMIFGIWPRKRNNHAIEILYARMTEGARRPFFYTDFDAPDTLEGRFDVLTVHALLVLRRLRNLPPPADKIAQELVDIFFREIDRSLREVGVGDLSVPKKMKVFAQTFYGRAQLYDEALETPDDDRLCTVLARIAGNDTVKLKLFAAHIRQVDMLLRDYSLELLLSESFHFPDQALTEPVHQPLATRT